MYSRAAAAGDLTPPAEWRDSATMAQEVLLVLSTFGSLEEARKVAQILVKEELAACVNILPGVESVYRWKGAVENAAEVLALIKTNAALYPRLEARLQQLHSYEVPEIVAFRVDAGLPAYLGWVAGSP